MKEKIKDKWKDLGPRVVSGVVLGVIGGSALMAGGVIFAGFLSICAGLMIWEVARMSGGAKARHVIFGVVAGALIFLETLMRVPGESMMLLGLAAALAYTGERDQIRLGAYAFFVLAACNAIWWLRVQSLPFALWLVVVVVTSDVLGYFAGKAIGGRKFWPSISPKKTWAGTIAGWIGAAVVGAFFAEPSPVSLVLFVGLSVLASFAGQMGDIVESALKRRAGVKDSSNLIPGHGGLLDRFDALMGAAMVLYLLLDLARNMGH